jgi:hypothetical protein
MEKGPAERDNEITQNITDELLPQVVKWCGNDLDKEEIRSAVFAAIDDSFTDDGYAIARDLERAGWEVDAELVEIFTDVSPLRRKWYQIARSKWVADEGIVIPFGLGDTVLPTGFGKSPQIVVKLMPGTAEIGTHSEWVQPAKRWFVYPVEDVTFVKRCGAYETSKAAP